MLTRRTFVQSALMASLSAPALAQPADGLLLVRYASVGGGTDVGLFLAEENGFFRDEGVRVDMQRIPNIPNLVTALATEQLDAAGIPIAPGLFAAARRGVNLRFVGDKQSLRKGISATRLLVRAQSWKGDEASTLQGLRGKPIAGPGRTSIGYYLVAQILKKHGMKLDDVNFVELQLPSMVPAMTNGAIEACIIIDPFMAQALRSGLARVLSDLTEFVPPGGTIVPLIYSEKFTRDRKAAQGFMNAYMRGVRLYNDAICPGGDRRKSVEVIARRMGAEVALIEQSADIGLDPDQKLDASFLSTLQDFFVEQKLLDQPADLGKLVDDSFAEEVLKKFGAYK